MTQRETQLSESAPVIEDTVPTWDDIARNHWRFMYSVAYRLCGNNTEAEDVVQTALVRVERGLKSYRPGNLEGWLARITTNVFLDEARRRGLRRTEALPDDAERVLVGAPGADEAATAALPDYIQAALGRLSEDHRAALVLCDVIGMSYPEIAEALDVPVGTVRSRIHRGRSAMRDMLRPHLEVDQ